MAFRETLRDASIRSWRTPKLPPPRTLLELAVEFGVPWRSLVEKMKHCKIAAPKPMLVSKGTVRNTWYNAKEMREWWGKVTGG